MRGNILFRESLQSLRVTCASKSIPWDDVIPQPLLGDWLSYFSMLHGLGDVTFPRSIKPYLVNNGTVAYVLWTLEDKSRKAALFVSKAKLAPLTHKGEVVKSELSGSTYAARLMIFIQQESCLKFNSHIHFLDSQIVQYMMKKESYGYNTFAGLRVAEIQKKTDIFNWLHIPSEENIADILTKGATPDKIGLGSTWQTGPHWLTKDRNFWPVTEIILNEEDKQRISKFVCKNRLEDVSKCLVIGSKNVDSLVSGIFDDVIDRSSSLDH